MYHHELFRITERRKPYGECWIVVSRQAKRQLMPAKAAMDLAGDTRRKCFWESLEYKPFARWKLDKAKGTHQQLTRAVETHPDLALTLDEFGRQNFPVDPSAVARENRSSLMTEVQTTIDPSPIIEGNSVFERQAVTHENTDPLLAPVDALHLLK